MLCCMGVWIIHGSLFRFSQKTKKFAFFFFSRKIGEQKKRKINFYIKHCFLRYFPLKIPIFGAFWPNLWWSKAKIFKPLCKNKSSMACIQWDILLAKFLISKIAFLIMLKEILLLKPFTNFSFFSQQMAIFFCFFAKN